MPVCLGSGDTHDEGEKITASGTGRKVSAPPEALQLWNRFTDLMADELGAVR